MYALAIKAMKKVSITLIVRYSYQTVIVVKY